MSRSQSPARVGVKLTLPLGIAIVLAIASPLDAQKVRLEVLPPAQNAWGEAPPSISPGGLLSDAAMRDLLANGFPPRLHYRLARRSSGRWFDDVKAASD